MKVAILTETFLPQINGIVRTIEKIVHYLEDHGHEVMVVTLGEGVTEYSNSKVIRIPGVKLAFYKELHLVAPKEPWLKSLFEKLEDFGPVQLPFATLQALIPSPHPEVEKALKDFNPDIIHLATPATLGAIGYYYVEKMGIPCLSTFHTDLAAYTQQYNIPYFKAVINSVNKFIYNRTNRVLAPSPSSKKQLEAIGIENVGVFGRGVDTELYNPNKANKSILKDYGLDPDKLTILYVGRVAEEKSLPILAEAFKKLDNAQLLIVGDGPARPLLESELEGTLHAFTGVKKGEELAELYASADVFAFPSKTETFGQVVLEAMASGLPVLGFESPGVSDLIIHEKTGYLADSECFDSFSEYLSKLVSNNKLREDFAKAGREEALKRTWQQVLNGLFDEYSQVANSTSSV